MARAVVPGGSQGELISATHTARGFRNNFQARPPDLSATILTIAVATVCNTLQGRGDIPDRLGSFIAYGIHHLIIFPLLSLLGGIA